MRHANKVAARAVVLLTALALAACNSTPTRDPAYAATRPAVPAPPAPAGGAIFQPGYEMVLFEDLRARRVGDILTIKLMEQTNASKTAETNIERTNDTSVTNPTVLGSTVRFDAPGLPFGKELPLASTSGNTLETRLQSDHEFDGKGESTQSNSLTGEISVTIAEVLPNGYLVVQGEKLLTLNRGHEHVRISGIVRPFDIGSDNTVLSTKVADAQIVYAGEGEVADSNIMGWLGRFFISALFPF